MGDSKHTPEPWMIEDRTEAGQGYSIVSESAHYSVAGVAHYISHRDAHLIAAAPDMLEALRLHQAWHDSESTGPDYGGQSRNTHPDGEHIWKAWWRNQLDICDRATTATSTAIAKAEGHS